MQFWQLSTEQAMVVWFIDGMMRDQVKMKLFAKKDIKLNEAINYLVTHKEIRTHWKSMGENEAYHHMVNHPAKNPCFWCKLRNHDNQQSI